MKLYDRSEIDRPASAVWPYVVHAGHFRQWNDKIVAVEATGLFELGQTFHTQYRMSGREMRCWSKVTALEPGRLLELHHANCSGKGARRELEVVELMTLEEKDGRTVVRKEITVRNHGVPWILQPLIWFVTRLGKPSGKDKLKEMCEGDLEQRSRLLEGQGVLRRSSGGSIPDGAPVNVKGGSISDTVSRDRDERS